MHRFFATLTTCLLCAGLLPVIPASAAETIFVEEVYSSPVDAFSVTLSQKTFRWSMRQPTGWSDWQTYDDDGDGTIGAESELIMLPRDTTGIRVEDIKNSADIHEISVSHEPAKPRSVSVNGIAVGALSRFEWGADASYLYAGAMKNDQPPPDPDAVRSDNGGFSGQSDQRVQDCAQAQKNYPEEFRYASTVSKDPQGRSYLWPLQYSKSVKMLVVHHSALVVQGDPRPSVERVRAIYKYHALTKGWGDIGYHYVIDENGQVYEGRQGGEYVVGGHAYCNNTGTVGIVLLGNFEIEQPTQAQAKGLQSLLLDLSKTYKINLQSSVTFHGKKFDAPIVRHKDLLSTLCPGYYLSSAFSQIVQNVRDGRPSAAVSFPPLPTATSSPSVTPVLSSPQGLQEGIAFTGRTSISINPGGKQRLSFTYTAGPGGAYEGKRVADVKISSPDIILSVDNGITWVPITKGVLLPSDLPAYETISLQMVIEAPMNAGEYWMEIGGLHFTISVSGRRARTGNYVSPFTAQTMQIVRPRPVRQSTVLNPRVRPQSRRTLSSPASSITTPSVVVPFQTISNTSSSNTSDIRIRLSADSNPTIRFASSGQIDNQRIAAGTALSLFSKNGMCEAQRSGQHIASGNPVRISSSSDILTVEGIKGLTRSYHGIIECRVLDGSLVLINELPLEEYMAGISEEPDTELYEKQRAFAIAARTYAAYYMNPDTRKFAGMPYDGSDDPANFQAYAGVGTEAANPRWVQAVTSTANQVLRYQNKIFKPAYFSSDDGRTRSPAEIGWKNFPAAEIFASKQDPWCTGLTLRGHGVGMSGCGAKGQAQEGRSAAQILQYYYPGARITQL